MKLRNPSAWNLSLCSFFLKLIHFWLRQEPKNFLHLLLINLVQVCLVTIFIFMAQIFKLLSQRSLSFRSQSQISRSLKYCVLFGPSFSSLKLRTKKDLLGRNKISYQPCHKRRSRFTRIEAGLLVDISSTHSSLISIIKSTLKDQDFFRIPGG